MVEDDEAKGREVSWLHMGILPLLKSNDFWVYPSFTKDIYGTSPARQHLCANCLKRMNHSIGQNHMKKLQNG
jgi:hypothetical protein